MKPRGLLILDADRYDLLRSDAASAHKHRSEPRWSDLCTIGYERLVEHMTYHLCWT
jgi:hypothetical protein